MSKRKPRALIVDDEVAFAEDIAGLVKERLKTDVVADPASALTALDRRSYDIVFLDVDLQAEIDGIELLKRLHELDPELPVVMLTNSADPRTIIESIKGGAFYYVIKGTAPSILELIHIAELAIEDARLRRSVTLMDEFQDDPLNAMQGTSPAVRKIRDEVLRVGPLDCAVLITGESGTGKELVARALHAAGAGTRRGRFVAVNSAGLPEQLVESELFGHEKGAFTGADRRRDGKFEHAKGGTIFLDEIGDMPAQAQAKLLRILQEREFSRVGSNTVIDTDARVISATNRDLRAAVDAGEFRDDLHYRINEFVIDVPPLRDRREDIPAIATRLVQDVGMEIGRGERFISQGALDLLTSRDWARNNVRELRNAIVGALIRCDGDTLQPGDFSFDDFVSPEEPPEYSEAKRVAVEHFQRRYFTHLLRLTNGNVAAAARKAGVHSAAFHRHLSNLGIDSEDFRS